MKNLFRCITVFTGLVLFSCAGTGKPDRVSLEYYYRIPIPAEFTDYPAVVLEDDAVMEMRINEKNQFSEFTRKRVVKIQNRDGYHLANVMIPFTRQNSIHIDYAFTVDSMGNIFQVLPEEIYEIPLYPDFVFYSDQKARIFTFPAVQAGSILVYKYTIKFSYLTPSNAWYFQDNIPVLLSRFKLIYPGGLEIRYKEYGIRNAPEILKNPAGFQNYILWEERNIPPIRLELNMPVLRSLARRVVFSPLGMSSWQDVARWYGTLFYSAVQPEIPFRKDMPGEHSDPVVLAKRIYTWIQDHIRYVAVEMGSGGYQPHPANEVFMKKYGDCKDMVALACSIGKQYGLSILPVLVPFRTFQYVDTSLATPAYFNHLIGMIRTERGDTIFMDFTSTYTPFGQIPWYLQGQWGLVIDENLKGKLTRLPVTPPDQNLIIDRADVFLTSEEVHVIGQLEFTGNPAEEMQRILAGKDSAWIENDLMAIIADHWLNVKPDSIRYTRCKDTIRVQYAGSFPFAHDNGGKMVFFNPAFALHHKPHYLFEERRRENGIVLKYCYENRIERKFHLSGKWKKNVSNTPLYYSDQFGSVGYQLQDADSMLFLSVFASNRQIEIPGEKLGEFKDFLKVFSELEKKYLIFRPE